MINSYQKELCKTIRELGYKYDTNKVFCDFLECSAIEISNAVDPLHKEEREKRYIEIMKSYEKLEERQKFFKMFVDLFMALDNNITSGEGLNDVLGVVFHELEFHNKYKGQFFTPQTICDFMGICSVDRELDLKEKGYVTICEPCSGSGAMIFGYANAIKNQGINYSNQMVVTATDIDIKCVYMCYIQLALYGIPAVVIHGDTLGMKEWSRWYTPVYIMDNWLWRQTCGNRGGRYMEDEKLKMIFNPQYAAMREVFGYGNNAGEENKTKLQGDEVKEQEQTKHERVFVPEIVIAESKNGQLKFDF